MDYLTLGPVPSDEPCAQINSSNYITESRKEAVAYISQLHRTFTTMPDNAHFGTKIFTHDFGTYREVVIYFAKSSKEAREFAFSVEDNLPANWDQKAHEELSKED